MTRNERYANLCSLFKRIPFLAAVAGVLFLFGCQPQNDIAVEISEVVSSNSRSYVSNGYNAMDWIELHNKGDKPVSLNGWILTDKYSSRNSDSRLPNITLAPDGYCVLFASKNTAGTGSLCLPFGLSRDGETLYLFNSDGIQVDQVQIPALEKDVSWAKGPGGAFGYCLLPTPEKANEAAIFSEMPAAKDDAPTYGILSESSPLVITEVVSSNGTSYFANPYGATDWIELHNRSDRNVSLKDWYLSDRGTLDDGSCALPDFTLPPGGYYVILADTEGAETGDRCLPFSIRKSGETLFLFESNGQRAAVLNVPALEKDVSWALGRDGNYGYCFAPTPGQENTSEIVAELPASSADNALISSRQSEIPLQISEICSWSAAGEPDWIELYNPSDKDVDTAGFYLSDSSANPVKGSLPALTAPACGYLVIPLGPAVNPNNGIVGLSLSAEGETIKLFDRELGLVDMVEIPPLREGVVYARSQDGVFGYCGVPTPGSPNTSGIHEEPLRTMDAEFPLHINEGLFRNRYSIIDTYGDRSDWVELTNRSKEPCSLKDCYLSDDRNEPTKWALPERELAPGEYLLVFLSGKDSVAEELHASFSVSDKDEGCFLYSAEELAVEWLAYPKDLPENVSLGLDSQGGAIYYAYPTPGYANARAFSGSFPAAIFPAGAVFINEVSAGGDSGDWVELYNRSDSEIQLTGWYLSDDADNLKKKSLDGLSIGPQGYTVVNLPEKGGDAFFSISLYGEDVLLSDEKGAVLDVFSSGVLKKGCTSGRIEKAPEEGRVFFEHPTPKQENSLAVHGYAGQPVFSDRTLYHNAPFLLILQVPDAETVVHYTLDGSVPTDKSPIYTDPLCIDRNTTLRAVGMAEGRFASEETVATYLFRQSHVLPVVCIAAEPDLWAKLTKAPSLEAGLEEQKAYLIYYEADGTWGTAFPAGISPRGNASLSYPQKSLSIHLRNTYGQSDVSYPFWGQDSFLPYRFLVLRNGSQDIRSARLRDSFANRAAEKLHVMKAKTRPVIVYVNGTYYGIMDLNEGMNHDYLWTHYHIDGDTVNIIQRNKYAKRGSAAGFVALRQFPGKNNMADDAAYTEFSRKVDMDAIIDYLIAQSFFGNYDIHNQNWWSTSDGAILWQPMLYDIDRCLNEGGASSNVLGMYFNPSGVVHNRLGDRIYMEIYCGLKKNAGWRQRFVERYAQVLCTEFSEERLQELLTEMADTLRPEMAEHISRWKMPDSMDVWEKNITEMHQYIAKRYGIITGQIKRQFSLSDTEWDSLMNKYNSN